MKKLFSLALLLFTVSVVSAQRAAYSPDYHRNRPVSLHVGAAFPVGKFADADDGTGAATGINLGIKSVLPITDYGLGLMLGADVMFNGLNGEAKDYLEELAYESGVEGVEKMPMFINVPVVVGFNYKGNVADKLGLWLETGVGPNIRFITKEKYFGDGIMAVGKYKSAVVLGLQAGAGIMIDDRFSMGLHYYALPESKVKVKTTLNGSGIAMDSGYEDMGRTTTQNMIVLRLGFHF